MDRSIKEVPCFEGRKVLAAGTDIYAGSVDAEKVLTAMWYNKEWRVSLLREVVPPGDKDISGRLWEVQIYEQHKAGEDTNRWLDGTYCKNLVEERHKQAFAEKLSKLEFLIQFDRRIVQFQYWDDPCKSSASEFKTHRWYISSKVRISVMFDQRTKLSP